MLEAAWSYIENAVPFLLIAVPFILGWRVISAFITSKSRGCPFFKSINFFREIFILMFAFYVIWLVSQTIMPHMEWSDGGFVIIDSENYVAKYNYTPFAAISDALYKIFVDINLYYVIYLMGNILVFIPVGFFAGLLPPQKVKWWHVALVSFMGSAVIETVQLFLPRMVDIDDVILNTLGGLIGFAIFTLLSEIAPRVVERIKNVETDI